MQIYNNDGRSSNRGKSTCSYCGNPDHNATNCPRVAEDYAWFTQSPPVIPIGVSATPNTRQYYAQPRYWGEWFERCLVANEKQLIAKAKASSSRTGSARSAPKCGFCGSKDHNRRNCSAMTDYVDRAHKANQNWRGAFYKKFVDELGISEGALLTIEEKKGYNETKESMGIVTSVNWDELSLFCSTKETSRYCYRDGQYKQHLIVTVQIGNETKVVSFGDGISIGTTDNNLVKYTGNGWSAPEFLSVLSPSITCKGIAWIEEGHRKSLEFLVKKRSLAKLDNEGVTALIDHWS